MSFSAAMMTLYATQTLFFFLHKTSRRLYIRIKASFSSLDDHTIIKLKQR
jgi:hypothetical protein